jgi:predicted dehydrogenase
MMTRPRHCAVKSVRVSGHRTLTAGCVLCLRELVTDCRTNPQGGFLLDGGVHYAAGLRKLLGDDNAIESLTAQTGLISEHLPPIDTFNAVLKTKTGAFGSYCCSVGSTIRAFDFHIACEKGLVQAESTKVITIHGTGPDAPKEEKVFEKTSGVKEEVNAWVESLVSGQSHPEQSPELALGDLELQEKIFTSGDQDGKRQTLEFQVFAA